MNLRKLGKMLLNLIPACRIGYMLIYFIGFISDDVADDLFCKKMLLDYQKDTDPEKDKTFSLEECEREWGLR